MLSDEEAQKKRALIEELHAKYGWEKVRRAAEERALVICSALDRGVVPDMLDVQELADMVLRVEAAAVSESWNAVEARIATLAVAAAEDERARRALDRD